MVAARRLTIDEFAAMPLEGRWELIDGEPIAATPSAGRSSHIGGRLYARLASFVEPSGVGWAYPADAGFILFENRATVRSPDVVFVRRDRLDEPPDSFVPLAPDVAMEVLSPSGRRPDALAKVAMYLQAGVRLVWLIDRARRTVTVFDSDDTITTHSDGDVLDGGEVLPEFHVHVSEIVDGFIQD